KKSLTGDTSERVDTRALQVLYALPDPTPIKVYVGQQMDVFLAVDSPTKSMGNTPSAESRPANAMIEQSRTETYTESIKPPLLPR
ncbi:MAG: hypothetical protein ACLP7Q_22520, partial [Isosphaeraceae bacterium]